MRFKREGLRSSKIFFVVTICLQLVLFFLPINKGNTQHFSYWSLLREIKDITFFQNNFNDATIIFFIVSLATFFLSAATVILLIFIKNKRTFKNLALVVFIASATAYAFVFGMLWNASEFLSALYGFNGISLILSFLMIFIAVGIKVLEINRE